MENNDCRRFLVQNGFFEYLIEQFLKLSPKKQMKYTLMCIIKFLNVKKYRLYMVKKYKDILPKLLDNFKHSNARVSTFYSDCLCFLLSSTININNY